MITVYHVPRRLFHDVPHFDDQKLISFVNENKTKYILVAKVQTTDLEKAFELTNSIDRHWSENDQVVAFGEQLRSTSVGDIMFDGTDTYIVATCGFKKL